MGQIIDALLKFSYFEYMIAVIVLLVITLIIQASFRRRFNKYSAICNSQGMTGEQIAQTILDANGIDDVEITVADSSRTDYYNHREKIIFLSPEVYSGKSVTALGCAAHEAGHAIQFGRNSLPARFIRFIAPAADFSSRFAIVPIIAGVFISMASTTYVRLGYYIALAGLFVFLFAVLHSLVSLPIELNASKRAKKTLDGILGEKSADMKGVRKVLNAAALTYVAGLSNSLVSLLRMLSLVAGSKRR